jgi:predicted DNA-binding transcriptional regulator AlpA
MAQSKSKGLGGAAPSAMRPAPRYVTRAEAAVQMGCSVRHLERLAATGEGPPFVRHGARRVVYEEQGIADWMQARTE